MSAPLISGDALNTSRLDLIRERVANSSRDDLYAPAYADRRTAQDAVRYADALLAELSKVKS